MFLCWIIESIIMTNIMNYYKHDGTKTITKQQQIITSLVMVMLIILTEQLLKQLTKLFMDHRRRRMMIPRKATKTTKNNNTRIFVSIHLEARLRRSEAVARDRSTARRHIRFLQIHVRDDSLDREIEDKELVHLNECVEQ